MRGFVSFLALAVLAGGASGCRACSGDDSARAPIDAPAYGALGPVDDVDFAPYLATARAVIDHAPRPGPEARPPERAGQRVFVTFWVTGGDPIRATGLGKTLLDSVVAASEDAATRVGASQKGRIEIDVVTAAERAALDPEMRDSIFAIGLRGYAATDGPDHVGYVLPSEILADKLVNVSSEDDHTLKLVGDKIQTRIAERAKVDAHVVERMRVARFTVSEHLEGPAPGAPPIALLRSMPLHPRELSPDALLAAVRTGADYLARMTDAQGKFVYLYDPVTDATLKGYGTLRHAGAIYALSEAYGEMHELAWAQAADRAIGWMVPKIKATPDGSWLADNMDEEQQKVGGGGLALVAMAAYQSATGETKNLETMRALARYMVHAQYPDGHFRDNADVMREDPAAYGPGAKKLKKEVFYFTGEALLGLVRLYAIDPQPQWLAAARKGADWVVDVRDSHADLKQQIHDHWMSYALHDLYVLTKEPRYAEHAYKIARAIVDGERRPEALKGAKTLDYVGTFYDMGETTPTSTRLEALASDIELARAKGDDETWLRGPAMELACLMRGAQIDDASVYFARNPARAMGGVRESLLNFDVRIDYDQHAMSGWLRLARELRDPGWGKNPPPR